MSPNQHLAALLPSEKAGHFELTQRETPTPGPNELLIDVKSIALNPIDYYQRDMGFPPLASYPAIVGSDIAGTIASVGSSVGSFSAGTRVAAFAPSFFKQGVPDYGAFQTKVLVPSANVVPLPDNMNFNEASLLPMAVATTWSAWYSIGLPRETKYGPADQKGLLIWGGASSIGTAAIQEGKMMGFSVYATASARNHDYLKKLGASRCFDYKDSDVVEQVVKAAKVDGITIDTGLDAAGQVQSCLDILEQTKGSGTAKLATVVPMSDKTPKVAGVDVKFVAAPEGEEARNEQFQFVFNVWLKEKLQSGEFVPSPVVKLVDGGLEGVDKGLDELKRGVSGLKLVVEIA